MAKIPSALDCPLDGRCMRLRHFYPLFAFLVPTIVIGYGFVIPRSPIAGINQFTIWFGGALLSATIAYWQGVRFALRRDTSARS